MPQTPPFIAEQARALLSSQVVTKASALRKLLSTLIFSAKAHPKRNQADFFPVSLTPKAAQE